MGRRWILHAIVLGATASTLALASSPLWAPGTPLAEAAVFAFRGLCHQDPERSFAVGGHVMAICHRCTGIDVGLVLGAAAAGLGVRVPVRSRLGWGLPVGAMGLQVLLGWLAPATFDHAPLRVATGVLLGAWLAAVLVAALATLRARQPGAG